MPENPIEQAAFRVLLSLQHTIYPALMAFKYGGLDSLRQTREELATALSAIDEILSKEPQK